MLGVAWLGVYRIWHAAATEFGNTIYVPVSCPRIMSRERIQTGRPYDAELHMQNMIRHGSWVVQLLPAAEP